MTLFCVISANSGSFWAHCVKTHVRYLISWWVLVITGSITRSASLPVYNLLRGRFWGFSPRRGDTLHRWRWNLAWRRGPRYPPPCQISPLHRCNDRGAGPQNWSFYSDLTQMWNINAPQRRNFAGKRMPRVCYSTPNLALIGKRGKVQELPKWLKFAQNCGFWPPEADTMNTFRWNLVCKCNLASAVAHQIWPSLLKGSRYRSPENPHLRKIVFLATRSRHSEHIQMKFGL